jgi:hypothetical protein
MSRVWPGIKPSPSHSKIRSRILALAGQSKHFPLPTWFSARGHRTGSVTMMEVQVRLRMTLPSSRDLGGGRAAVFVDMLQLYRSSTIYMLLASLRNHHCYFFAFQIPRCWSVLAYAAQHYKTHS